MPRSAQIQGRAPDQGQGPSQQRTGPPQLSPTPPRPGPPLRSSGTRQAASSSPATRSTTPPPTPFPKRHDVRPTPPRPKSNKKKVVCPAGKNCTCGSGRECPTCGGCLDGGCVPPCPEALKQIEYKQFEEEARAETPSSVMTQPETSKAALQGSHGW